MKHIIGEILKPFLFLTTLFVLSVWLGYTSGQVYPKESLALFEHLISDFAILKDVNSAEMFAFIFLNNTVKAFAIVLLGFFFGVIPILFITINGILIGLTSSVVIAKLGVTHLLVGIIPHGVLEVPAFLIAGSYGLQLAKRYYRKLRRREPFRPALMNALKKTAKYVMPLLAIAAFIETFITASLLRAY